MVETADKLPGDADFDFGVPVAVLKRPEDFTELPVEVAVRRAERLAAEPEPEPVVRPKDNAVAAIKAEVEDDFEGTTFVFDGETYKIPLQDDWDVEIYEANDTGKVHLVIRLILGDFQWDKFKSEIDPANPMWRRKKKRVAKDLVEMMDAINKAGGTQPGE